MLLCAAWLPSGTPWSPAPFPPGIPRCRVAWAAAQGGQEYPPWPLCSPTMSHTFRGARAPLQLQATKHGWAVRRWPARRAGVGCDLRAKGRTSSGRPGGLAQAPQGSGLASLPGKSSSYELVCDGKITVAHQPAMASSLCSDCDGDAFPLTDTCTIHLGWAGPFRLPACWR